MKYTIDWTEINNWNFDIYIVFSAKHFCGWLRFCRVVSSVEKPINSRRYKYYLSEATFQLNCLPNETGSATSSLLFTYNFRSGTVSARSAENYAYK